MTQHGRVRMLSMSVVIIGVAVAVGAVGLLVSRQSLLAQMHTQADEIQSLTAQVRALGAVPITEQPKPEVAPSVTTTTVPRAIRSSPSAPVAPAGRSTTTTTDGPSPPATAPPAPTQPSPTTTQPPPPPCQTQVLGRCVVP